VSINGKVGCACIILTFHQGCWANLTSRWRNLTVGKYTVLLKYVIVTSTHAYFGVIYAYV